jgi:hypothetical protein
MRVSNPLSLTSPRLARPPGIPDCFFVGGTTDDEPKFIIPPPVVAPTADSPRDLATPALSSHPVEGEKRRKQ